MARWMAALRDETMLSELTIPGAHDAATRGVTRMARCQDLSLSEQLAAGIRYLDIRLRVERGALALYHGRVSLGLGFETDVQPTCLRFLDRNPTEAVVLLISNESGEAPDEFERLLRSAIAHDPGRWVLRNQAPRLGAVRGRIVLIRRIRVTSGAMPFGIDASAWPDDRAFRISGAADFEVQDKYIVPTVAAIARKWNDVAALLDRAPHKPPATWILNYCSGTSGRNFEARRGEGDAGPYPDTVARGTAATMGMNDRLRAYLETARPSHPLGTIMLDFPDRPLIERLVAVNRMAV